MQITVLGKSPAWQDADGACSGYLVEESGHMLLLDCGNGVFAKLRSHTDYAAIDAVVVSHLHADHFLDLVPFAYALMYAPRHGAPARPRLCAPPGARDTFGRVTGTWDSPLLIEQAFTVEEYDGASVLEIGPLRVRFHPVPHFVPAWAVEITSTVTGGRFTFGADCGPSEALVQFARDTDLLLIEAALADPSAEASEGHLTPAQAGEHGRRAGAKRLVVTHFPDEVGREHVREQAARAYGREVALAHEGAVFTL